MCIALCTIVAHSIAQNRPDNFSLLPSRQSPLLRCCLFEGRGAWDLEPDLMQSNTEVSFPKVTLFVQRTDNYTSISDRQTCCHYRNQCMVFQSLQSAFQPTHNTIIISYKGCKKITYQTVVRHINGLLFLSNHQLGHVPQPSTLETLTGIAVVAFFYNR